MLQVHETKEASNSLLDDYGDQIGKLSMRPKKPATVCWMIMLTRLASCSHVMKGGACDNRQCAPNKPIPVYRCKFPLQLWVSCSWWHCHCFQDRCSILYCSLPGCGHRQQLTASLGLKDLKQSQSPKIHMACLCVWISQWAWHDLAQKS